MIVINEGGQIQALSVEAAQLFGYSPEALLGYSVDRIIPERFRAEHDRQMTLWFANPEDRVIPRDLCGVDADGKEFPVSISLHALKGMLKTMQFEAQNLCLAIVKDLR